MDRFLKASLGIVAITVVLLAGIVASQLLSERVMTGVLISVLSSMLINLGVNMQVAQGTRKTGLSLFVLGTVGNLCAFQFAPASLLMPVEIVQILTQGYYDIAFSGLRPKNSAMYVSGILLGLGAAVGTVFAGPRDPEGCTFKAVAADSDTYYTTHAGEQRELSVTTVATNTSRSASIVKALGLEATADVADVADVAAGKLVTVSAAERDDYFVGDGALPTDINGKIRWLTAIQLEEYPNIAWEPQLVTPSSVLGFWKEYPWIAFLCSSSVLAGLIELYARKTLGISFLNSFTSRASDEAALSRSADQLGLVNACLYATANALLWGSFTAAHAKGCTYIMQWLLPPAPQSAGKWKHAFTSEATAAIALEVLFVAVGSVMWPKAMMRAPLLFNPSAVNPTIQGLYMVVASATCLVFIREYTTIRSHFAYPLCLTGIVASVFLLSVGSCERSEPTASPALVFAASFSPVGSSPSRSPMSAMSASALSLGAPKDRPSGLRSTRL